MTDAVAAWEQRPRMRLVYAITCDEHVVGNCELKLGENSQAEIGYGCTRTTVGTDMPPSLVASSFNAHSSTVACTASLPRAIPGTPALGRCCAAWA